MKRLIAFLATKAKDEPNEVRSALLCLITSNRCLRTIPEKELEKFHRGRCSRRDDERDVARGHLADARLFKTLVLE